jgi:hypothetical protein
MNIESFVEKLSFHIPNFLKRELIVDTKGPVVFTDGGAVTFAVGGLDLLYTLISQKNSWTLLVKKPCGSSYHNRRFDILHQPYESYDKAYQDVLDKVVCSASRYAN